MLLEISPFSVVGICKSIVNSTLESFFAQGNVVENFVGSDLLPRVELHPVPFHYTVSLIYIIMMSTLFRETIFSKFE